MVRLRDARGVDSSLRERRVASKVVYVAEEVASLVLRHRRRVAEVQANQPQRTSALLGAPRLHGQGAKQCNPRAAEQPLLDATELDRKRGKRERLGSDLLNRNVS